jgi:hypothetical protein
MLLTDVVAYLLTQTAITSVVGESIQPIPAPVDMTLYPCVTVQSPSYVPEYANNGPVGVSNTRVVFDCLASTYLVARSLAETLAATFSAFSGTLPNGTEVREAEVVNILDRWDDGSKISCSQVHIIFTYEE